MQDSNVLGLAPTKFDGSKTVYVVMANDRTHVFANPDGSGEPFWTYNEREIDVVMMSLKKDFKNNKYSKVTLSTAITLIGEKQAELATLWKPAILEMSKKKDLPSKWEIYARAKKKLGAHPIILDEALKLELQID